VNCSVALNEGVRTSRVAPPAAATFMPAVARSAPVVSSGPTAAGFAPLRMPARTSFPGAALAARMPPRLRPSRVPVVSVGKDGVDVPRQASLVLDVVGNGGGQPLDPTVRADVEDRLGSDFSDVRIHTGDKAAKSAAAISAQAYTVGNEVVFGRGYYEPASLEGRHRIVHELVHVQQQRAGPVSGTDNGGGVTISDPKDFFEQEAEATATRIVSSPRLVSGRDLRNGHRGRPSATWTAARSVQRCGGVPCDCAIDEEDPVQRNSVDGPSLKAVQRAMVCPVGVDPAEGTGCYEVPDADLPGHGISSPGAVNDNVTAEDLSGAPNEGVETGLAEGAEAGEVGEAVEGAEVAQSVITAGGASQIEPGFGTIIGAALIIGGVTYLAYKRLTENVDTSSEKRDSSQPKTGPQPYPKPQAGKDEGPDCQSANMYWIPCEEGISLEEQVIDYIGVRGYDYSSLGDCWKMDDVDSIDSCNNAPGESWHCEIHPYRDPVSNEDHPGGEVSAFKCLCCQPDGTSGYEWKGLHFSRGK
jgi:hypothetical protein